MTQIERGWTHRATEADSSGLGSTGQQKLPTPFLKFWAFDWLMCSQAIAAVAGERCAGDRRGGIRSQKSYLRRNFVCSCEASEWGVGRKSRTGGCLAAHSFQ